MAQQTLHGGYNDKYGEISNIYSGNGSIITHYLGYYTRDQKQARNNLSSLCEVCNEGLLPTCRTCILSFWRGKLFKYIDIVLILPRLSVKVKPDLFRGFIQLTGDPNGTSQAVYLSVLELIVFMLDTKFWGHPGIQYISHNVVWDTKGA